MQMVRITNFAKMANRLWDAKYSGFLVVAFVVAGWEICCRLGWINSNFLPPISLVLETLFGLLFSFEIVNHAVVTLRRILGGYLLGAFAGYLLGFLCGYLPRIYNLLELTIEYLRPMPSVALIPIGILFLGIGDALNTVIIAWACSWPVFINTMDGVRNTDSVLINTGLTFGFKRWGIIREIIMPASLPFVFSGLRVSLGIAVAVAVITEMVASGNGLGSFILQTSLSYRVPELYSGIVFIGLFGYMLNRLFLVVERKALGWRKGFSLIGR